MLLVALIVFIAENTQTSTVNFLGAHGRAPTAVMLLIAAVTGALVVGVVGADRQTVARPAARRVPSSAASSSGGRSSGSTPSMPLATASVAKRSTP